MHNCPLWLLISTVNTFGSEFGDSLRTHADVHVVEIQKKSDMKETSLLTAQY